MQQTRLIMGMPVTVKVVDTYASPQIFRDVFSLFRKVDAQFSPYKKESEVSRINRKEIQISELSDSMKEIVSLAEKTKNETHGYFDVYRNGYFDPSGIVKGWAIQKAAKMLKKHGFYNFYIEAGGDIQAGGYNEKGEAWTVGIQHPFDKKKIVKTVKINNQGVATSGTYLRGDHIYNPLANASRVNQIVSLTVIGPDIYNADRFATAAFAMGKKGIEFINSCTGYAGYMIDIQGIATYTQSFETYAVFS